VVKICSKCKSDKEFDCFAKGKCYSDGYQTICKECQKAFRKLRKYDELRREAPDYKEYNDKRNKEYSATVNGRARYLHNSAKKRALEKNLEFDLPFEFIAMFLQFGVCQKTGIRFDLSSGKGRKCRNPFAPSIDRINSFEGYTPGNVQFVCDMYNHGKGQHTDDEFIRFCHVVAQRNPLK